MKSVKITFSDDTGRQLTVVGRGDPSQTARKIVKRVEQIIPKYFDQNQEPENVEIKNFEQLERTKTGNSGSDLLTIQVNDRTDERFCRRNYGYQYGRKDHPKAEGPVGPTRIN